MNKKNNKILISIGSNNKQSNNISRAKLLLEKHFNVKKYSSLIWTEPIGLASDHFLNGLVYATTDLPVGQTIQLLKNIELNCGVSQSEKENGIVKIDLDLLQYNSMAFHNDDWQRDYIKHLVCEMNL